MGKNTRFVGLDVHAETIAVAVAEGRNDVRSLGTIANRAEAVRRLVGKLGKLTEVKVCYEAGPTGYALYWQLTQLGVHCEVIAPSLVPMKSGDRIKTDRRDAERLARSYQAGDLTAVWVPDSKHEALRDLVRAREATKEDQLRAKHRLLKYLLRFVLDGSFHINVAVLTRESRAKRGFRLVQRLVGRHGTTSQLSRQPRHLPNRNQTPAGPQDTAAALPARPNAHKSRVPNTGHDAPAHQDR